jgi:hypothetical protein
MNTRVRENALFRLHLRLQIIKCLQQHLLGTRPKSVRIPADLNQVVTASPAPEPASLAIVGTALFGFGLIRRRRQRP